MTSGWPPAQHAASAGRWRYDPDGNGLVCARRAQVPELKKACEERGLKSTGLKAQLVERLKEALLAESAPAPAAQEPQTAEPPKA